MITWNLCVCVLAAMVYTAKAQDWSFETADSWADSFPKCGGSSQSPIALRIRNDAAGIQKKYSDLEGEGISYKLLNYDKTVSGIFSNTGRELELNFTETAPEETPAFEVTEDGTTTVYYLTSAGLHVDSSHTLQGARYYLEWLLVHTDSEGNLLILSFLPLRCNDPSALSDRLLEQFDSLIDPGTQVDIEAFSATEMLGKETDPDKLCNVIKYSGSLLRPPCTEGVTYFVMYLDSVCFTMDQINKLAEAKNNDGNSIKGYRPEQPVNDRTYDIIKC